MSLSPLHSSPSMTDEEEISVKISTTGEGENSDEVSSPEAPKVETLLQEDICSYAKEEIQAFVDMSNFFNANPRKIKRITNIYTCVRMLLPQLDEDSADAAAEKRKEQLQFREKLLAWIVLCEQWPVRMCWILQLLEDYEQANPDYEETKEKAERRKELYKKNLKELYFVHVETVVYDINGRDSLPEALKLKYQKAYSLDGDPEVFDQFITARNCGSIIVNDIGAGMSKRRRDRLLSFTVNLNPALKELIASISAYREEEQRISENMKKRFKRLSVHSLSDQGGLKNFMLGAKSQAPKIAAIEEGAAEDAKDEGSKTAGGKPTGDKPTGGKPKGRKSSASKPSGAEKAPQEEAPVKSDAEASEGEGKADNVQDRKESSTDNLMKDEEDASPSLEKKEGKGALVDDMKGVDHVGITNYALRISQLIVLKLETPSVFGIYATWGSGKSFLMYKIISKIKAVALSRLVEERYKQEISGYEQEIIDLKKKKKSSKTAERKKDKLTIDRDRILVDIMNISEESEEKLAEIYGCRGGKGHVEDFSEGIAEFVWYVEIFSGVLALARFIVALVKSCRDKTVSTMKSVYHGKPIVVDFKKEGGYLAGFIQESYATNPARVSSDEHKKASKKAKEEGRKVDEDAAVDYEFVWYNAWIYSGNDNLWAGLIKSLYTAVEKHYGPEYAYAERKADLIWGSMKLIFSFAVMIVCVTVYKQEVEIEDFTDITSMRSSAEISSAFGGIFATLTVAQTIYSLIVSPTSASKKIIKEASSANFRKKLGYMNDIKNNLAQIGKYLDQPSTVPTFWDFLLPKFLFSAHHLRTLNQYWRGNRRMRKCRLVIFVDDLDRCPPEKCVEVLQSLVLLTEGTPFVIFLAIDPRIVVTAIEVDNSKFFGDAGINGYEYLDKIVQIPFAWPSLVAEEKASLTRGYLTGDASPDGSLLEELAKKLGVEVNKKDIKKTEGVFFEGKFIVKIKWQGRCKAGKAMPSTECFAFDKLELLDLRDNDLSGTIPKVPNDAVMLLDGNPNLKGAWSSTPSHFWDFRGKSGKGDIKDRCSNLTAKLEGGAELTAEGLKLDGVDGHAKITNWEDQ
ncbi:hypothetical protein TrVE_jg7207 [Triparma verrucosa]|uniref:KAP NTPase domain-containing protein n=1 Tax=Triparma verrucosa TaxID=1606542 RepID=A0A9W7C1D4_9STRA|nr:hypothetical protein TrVE_jg7207 [Triparma verrucosa]